MFERSHAPVDYEPSYSRFDFFRNLAFLGFGAVVLFGSIWVLPRVVFADDGEEEQPGLTVPDEEDEVEEEVFEPSGRFQPVSLSAEHEWIGSREDTIAAPLSVVSRRVVLGSRGPSGALDPTVVLEVSEPGTPTPREFDPAQGLAFEEQVVGERSFLVSQVEGDPVQRVAWTEPSGRQVWASSRGLSVQALLDVLAGVSVIEPALPADEDEAAEGEGAAGEEAEEAEDGAGDVEPGVLDVAPTDDPTPEELAPQVLLSSRGGMDLLLDEVATPGELVTVRDNFAVPGRAEGSVSVVHVTGWSDFHPAVDAALSPTARLQRVRGVDAIADGVIRWREREDLVIEVEGNGYTQVELLDIAERLTELSTDALTERRPPVAEVRVVSDPTAGPEPEFDTSALGDRSELSNAVEGSPPFVSGQLVGPVVAVGRLESTDIDVFAWQRGDGRFRECVGVTGQGVEQVLCLTEDDDVSGPVRVGVAPIDLGIFAGGRVHVYRVPGRTSVVTAEIAGRNVQQRPLEGVAVFLAPDFSDITVRAYETDGTEILAVR
ncbi:MAG: hypothetical protein AAGA17_11795 [Actinomycetota bacterium]